MGQVPGRGETRSREIAVGREEKQTTGVPERHFPASLRQQDPGSVQPKTRMAQEGWTLFGPGAEGLRGWMETGSVGHVVNKLRTSHSPTPHPPDFSAPGTRTALAVGNSQDQARSGRKKKKSSRAATWLDPKETGVKLPGGSRVQECCEAPHLSRCAGGGAGTSPSQAVTPAVSCTPSPPPAGKGARNWPWASLSGPGALLPISPFGDTSQRQVYSALPTASLRPLPGWRAGAHLCHLGDPKERRGQSDWTLRSPLLGDWEANAVSTPR